MRKREINFFVVIVAFILVISLGYAFNELFNGNLQRAKEFGHVQNEVYFNYSNFIYNLSTLASLNFSLNLLNSSLAHSGLIEQGHNASQVLISACSGKFALQYIIDNNFSVTSDQESSEIADVEKRGHSADEIYLEYKNNESTLQYLFDSGVLKMTPLSDNTIVFNFTNASNGQTSANGEYIWNVPRGTSEITFRVLGAGGGGGGGAGGLSFNWGPCCYTRGKGGGSGGYGELTTSNIQNSYVLKVGKGGVGGTTVGGKGGDSVIVGELNATGGTGGELAPLGDVYSEVVRNCWHGETREINGNGGNGGDANSIIHVPGENGGNVLIYAVSNLACYHVANPWGTGTNAVAYGEGGIGGGSESTAYSLPGGNGADGRIEVEYKINACSLINS
ncbi:MAG: hypothetical protein AABX11_00100 [Nanoarchaeota archaeon]